MIGTITLGGRAFELRHFSLRENAKAYPLARKLVADGVIDRWIDAMERAREALASQEGGERITGAPASWIVDEDEMGQMADLVFMACHAADGALTRDVFDEFPIAPGELFSAFFEARYCTGAWKKRDPVVETEDEPMGEGDGEVQPSSPTSTSGE